MIKKMIEKNKEKKEGLIIINKSNSTSTKQNTIYNCGCDVGCGCDIGCPYDDDCCGCDD